MSRNPSWTKLYTELACLKQILLHWLHCTYSTDPSNKSLLEFYFILIIATLFLLNELIAFTGKAKRSVVAFLLLFSTTFPEQQGIRIKKIFYGPSDR